MSARPLRVGLIGAGRWVPAFIRTLRESPDWQLVRIARARAQPVDGVPESVEIITDWRRVAEADDLDAVIVSTPPHLHAEMTAACIRNGRPVLVEKPLTLSAPEAHDLLSIAESCRPIVFVDHIHLFNPAFRALHDAVRGRAPLVMEAEAGATPDRPIHDYPVLWDWGSHDVAMALTLAEGQVPRDVSARQIECDPSGRERVEITLYFENGTRCRHVVGNLWPERKRWLTVRLGHEMWRYDDCAEHKFSHSLNGQTEYPPVSSEMPLAVALKEFADAVRLGQADFRQLRLGVQVVNVLARCEKALTESDAGEAPTF